MKNGIKEILSIARHLILFIFAESILLTTLKLLYDGCDYIAYHIKNLKEVHKYIATFIGTFTGITIFLLTLCILISMIVVSIWLIRNLTEDEGSHDFMSIKTKSYDLDSIGIEKEKQEDAEYRK